MQDPSEEEIKQWDEIAQRRNAILPFQFQLIQNKEVVIICGNCKTPYQRPLIIAQNDPVFVCPGCQMRNYVPIDWNVIRRRRSSY